MSTLTLAVPDALAQRWDSLTEDERQRRAAAMIETMTAFDKNDQSPEDASVSPITSSEHTLADDILEALGPEFAFDPLKKGTRSTARTEGFPGMDRSGRSRP